MKLAEPVPVFLEEDKHKHFSLKQGQNFIVCLLFAVCVVHEQVTEHVIMLTEIFDKQGSIF